MPWRRYVNRGADRLMKERSLTPLSRCELSRKQRPQRVKRPGGSTNDVGKPGPHVPLPLHLQSSPMTLTLRLRPSRAPLRILNYGA